MKYPLFAASHFGYRSTHGGRHHQRGIFLGVEDGVSRQNAVAFLYRKLGKEPFEIVWVERNSLRHSRVSQLFGW
jgi:hypothetical protein